MSGLNRGQEIVREMIASRISSLNYIIENDKKNDWIGTFFCKDKSFSNITDFHEHIKTCDNI